MPISAFQFIWQKKVKSLNWKTTRANFVLFLPFLRSAAIEVNNLGLVREDAVVVERELLLELHLAVVVVGGEVLEGGLHVVLTRQLVEQGRPLETQDSQPVLVTQSHLEPELQDQPGDLNTSSVMISQPSVPSPRWELCSQRRDDFVSSRTSCREPHRCFSPADCQADPELCQDCQP